MTFLIGFAISIISIDGFRLYRDTGNILMAMPNIAAAIGLVLVLINIIG